MDKYIINEELIEEIWEKGVIIDAIDPTLFRKDSCGAWMRKDLYNVNSLYGWSINLTYPKSLGGDDNIENLRPMQYHNSINKGNDYPSYIATVQSDEFSNIEKTKQCIVNRNLQKKLKLIYKNKLSAISNGN